MKGKIAVNVRTASKTLTDSEKKINVKNGLLAHSPERRYASIVRPVIFTTDFGNKEGGEKK